jgi:hypothetical protein
LAADISFASFSLSIERGEGKVEVMLGRFAGVDRKAGNLGYRSKYLRNFRTLFLSRQAKPSQKPIWEGYGNVRFGLPPQDCA